MQDGYSVLKHLGARCGHKGGARWSLALFVQENSFGQYPYLTTENPENNTENTGKPENTEYPESTGNKENP